MKRIGGIEQVMCAKSLGPKLPQDLSMRLYQPDEAKARDRVILVTTEDQDGWPRHLMLSHYEMVAKDQSRLLFLVYAQSKSALNLERSGKVSLIFLDEEMSYYVRAQCKKVEQGITEAPMETLFEAQVKDVMEDKFPTTKITSGIRFTGLDPYMTQEGRKLVFQRLVERALASGQ